MALSMKLTDFLEKEKVPYEILIHPRHTTAVGTAVAEHVKPGQVAKVVMAKARGKDVMLVLPGTCEVDLFKLETALKTHDLRIEEEYEFQGLFSDCEAGAMPPFGWLYDVPCYVDLGIAACTYIIFNGGSHRESIKIRSEDYLRVAKAMVADFAVRKHHE
jgi:Ala-tRNA(Pro) deacylase